MHVNQRSKGTCVIVSFDRNCQHSGKAELIFCRSRISELAYQSCFCKNESSPAHVMCSPALAKQRKTLALRIVLVARNARTKSEIICAVSCRCRQSDYEKSRDATESAPGMIRRILGPAADRTLTIKIAGMPPMELMKPIPEIASNQFLSDEQPYVNLDQERAVL